MEHLSNSMRLQAGIGQNLLSQVRVGLIQSYNPNDGTVRVVVQPVNTDDPEGGQTGWIPLATNFIGFVGAPKQNDQVVVIFQEGNLNNGIVIGRLYNQQDIAPQTPEGEWWLAHESGTLIKVKMNGDVEIKAANKLILEGQEIDALNSGAIKKLVTEAFKDLFNQHTHGGSPPPDMPYQMSDAQLTTILKAE